MKKNILTILLVIAVLLFVFAGWKFWSTNYGDDAGLVDTVIPVENDIEVGGDDINENQDDIDQGEPNEETQDSNENDDGDDGDTEENDAEPVVATGSEVAGNNGEENGPVEDVEEGNNEETIDQGQENNADEDFDPKAFEDEEINELIELLEELLAE